jgi:ABC-type Fe3+/spermidine/putrescine transport system ATPase subunit
MSSRIVIMREGRVEQIGAPRDIYENPASVFASTFIGETNLLRGEVASASDGVVVVSVGEAELRVADPRGLAAGTPVALSIRPERITAAGQDLDRQEWNVLPGTVVEQVFLGNRTRARVTCGSITVWVEESSSTSAAARLAAEGAVQLAWPVADGRLIPAGDGG